MGETFKIGALSSRFLVTMQIETRVKREGLGNTATRTDRLQEAHFLGNAPTGGEKKTSKGHEQQKSARSLVETRR